MGLTGAWTTRLSLHSIPQPCSSYQQAQIMEWLAGVPAAQNFFSFLNNFLPHPCNVLAAVGPLFQLAFNLPNASSHRGDPQTPQNIPECKAFAMSHSCRSASKDCSRLREGTREEGSVSAAAEPVSKAEPRKDE